MGEQAADIGARAIVKSKRRRATVGILKRGYLPSRRINTDT